jgi:dihydroorotate dehydrogenase electron transfer subunit
MHQAKAKISQVGFYAPLPGFARLQLYAPTLAAAIQPGQFVLVDIETEYLRQPFFPVAIGEEVFSVLISPRSPLLRLAPGDELDCLGPFGNGFPLPNTARTLLTLAQDSGFGVTEAQNSVTYLLPLFDQALATDKRVVLLHEATDAAQLFPITGLPRDIEVRAATLNGTQGHRGGSLDLLPELAQWADQVYAVGKLEWYREVALALEAHRLHLSKGLAWALIAPELMPCGMGVCGGCAVETRRGFRFACSDGPVFDLSQI